MVDVEWWMEIAMRFAEHDLPGPRDRIDVVHIPRHVALEQMKRLLVPELVEDRPELVGPRDLPDPDRGRRVTWFQEPGRRHVVEERSDAIVVEDRHELRHEQPALLRLHAHRELVAKVADSALAHAGDAQVLAQRRRHLEIELVERHDPVDRLGSREPAHGIDHVIPAREVGDQEQLIDAVAWPLEVPHGFARDEQHPGAQAVAFANEVVALEVAGQTEDRDVGLGHTEREKWQPTIAFVTMADHRSRCHPSARRLSPPALAAARSSEFLPRSMPPRVDNLRESAHRVVRLVALGHLADAAAARERLGNAKDEEALHDFRVALRRLRSWERAFRPYIRDDVSKRLRQRLRNLARDTGASRDLEVHLAWLREQRHSLGRRQRPGLTWLLANLHARKEDADAVLEDDVDSRFTRLRSKLGNALASYREHLQVRENGQVLPPAPFAEALAPRVQDAASTLRAHLEQIRSLRDEDECHEARIEIGRAS